METRSPVVSNMSNSRRSGFGEIFFAMLSKSSVAL